MEKTKCLTFSDIIDLPNWDKCDIIGIILVTFLTLCCVPSHCRQSRSIFAPPFPPNDQEDDYDDEPEKDEDEDDRRLLPAQETLSPWRCCQSRLPGQE